MRIIMGSGHPSLFLSLSLSSRAHVGLMSARGGREAAAAAALCIASMLRRRNGALGRENPG